MTGDGAETLDMLDQCDVDVLILDITMPGEDGLSLLRRLRGALAVPVLVMTAVTDRVDRILGLELGADDLIVHPVEKKSRRIDLAVHDGRLADRPAVGQLVDRPAGA